MRSMLGMTNTSARVNCSPISHGPFLAMASSMRRQVSPTCSSDRSISALAKPLGEPCAETLPPAHWARIDFFALGLLLVKHSKRWRKRD